MEGPTDRRKMAGKSRYFADGFVCAGFMCGSSLDGLDGALIRVQERTISLLAFAHHPFDSGLSSAIRNGLSGNTPGGTVPGFCGIAENIVSLVEMELFGKLLESASMSAKDVDLIGSHGITSSHHPAAGLSLAGIPVPGHTSQLTNPHLLTEAFGIPVVSDFRRTDVAAGGQGAPLAPIFHRAVFTHKKIDRAFLNLGGIANITSLPSRNKAPVIAFDTGPGNMLIDAGARWVSNGEKDCDRNGEMAGKGRVAESLVQKVCQDPWMNRTPPKSTGREAWGEERFREIQGQMPREATPEDLMATLTEITALSVARSMDWITPAPGEIIVGGGGARNRTLLDRLRIHLKREVQPSETFGISAQAVESMAFAYLALLSMTQRPGTLPELTGGKSGRVLGTVTFPSSYPLASILSGMIRAGDIHLPFPDRARAHRSPAP